jgi:hypothetical protein
LNFLLGTARRPTCTALWAAEPATPMSGLGGHEVQTGMREVTRWQMPEANCVTGKVEVAVREASGSQGEPRREAWVVAVWQIEARRGVCGRWWRSPQVVDRVAVRVIG